MTLTPEQKAALAQAHATCPPRGNSALHYFLAGIAQGRAEAAKVCRDIAGLERVPRPISVVADTADWCAEAIEQP